MLMWRSAPSIVRRRSSRRPDGAQQRFFDHSQITFDRWARRGVAAPHARLLDHRADIDRLFASDTLEEVFAALEADGGDFAAQQLAILKTKSPQSMKVSLRLLYDGSLMQSFADEMRQEYAVATHVVQRHDFLEGVRAVIVDKDNSPRWNPATPEAVTGHLIDQIFAPLPPTEAWTPN